MKTLSQRAVLVAMMAASAGMAGTIPELETVFYGKVLTRSGGQDAQLHQGALSWTIRQADGTDLVLETELESLADGAYSYALRVPHQARAVDVHVDGGVIPLEGAATELAHQTIFVEGLPATIAFPGQDVFAVSQASRASGQRLDLRIGMTMPDTDGDGLPDWWEDLFGFDFQLAGEEDDDPDGDGDDNLAEFLAGTNPHLHHGAPSLRTTELTAYADGRTGIYLETIDGDSAPEDLVYTLTQPPVIGTLRLRDGVGEVVLGAGDSFTQQSLNTGRVVYEHAGSTAATDFTVEVRDEDPAHPAATGVIGVQFFRPGEGVVARSAEGVLREDHYLLSRDEDHVVWDFAANPFDRTILVPDDELRPQILHGGDARNQFRGGSVGDRLIAGAGESRFTGAGGDDHFVYLRAGPGPNRIEDFGAAEGDVVDLSHLIAGASPNLRDYVSLGGAEIRVDANGDGSGFTDLIINLAGHVLDAADLRTLFEAGNLVVGGPGLPPLLEVFAQDPLARENGPTPGSFSLHRSGSTDLPLTIAFSLTGVAENGVDYSQVLSPVVIPAGAASWPIAITPFSDGVTEGDEVVELHLVADAAYEVGPATSAQVVIGDLKPMVSIEAIQPLAQKDLLTPAVLLLSRTDALASSVVVQLDIAGTARNGIEYSYVLPAVVLQPFETAALIQVTPTGTAGTYPASVVVSVRPDPAYLAGDSDAAQAVIVEHTETFAQWLGGDAATPARLQEYAFPGGSVSIRVVEGYLQVEHSRNPSALDLQYGIEATASPLSWLPVSLQWDEQMSQPPGTAVYRAREPLDGAASLYLRVRAVQQP